MAPWPTLWVLITLLGYLLLNVTNRHRAGLLPRAHTANGPTSHWKGSTAHRSWSDPVLRVLRPYQPGNMALCTHKILGRPTTPVSTKKGPFVTLEDACSSEQHPLHLVT